jgi:hypothetical protein
MKTLIAVSLIFASAMSTTALAETVTDDAHYVAEVTLSDAMLDAQFEALGPLLRPALQQQLHSVGLELSPSALTAFQDMYIEEFKIAFSDSARKKVAEVYQKELTEDELSDLVTFMKSPTGASYFDKLPLLTTKSSQAGAQVGALAGPKAFEGIAKRLAAGETGDFTGNEIESLKSSILIKPWID